MTTVMPPEVQAYIDGIPPGPRPLFERLHRLILTAHPGAQVTLSDKMPACKAGNRRLYVGAANMGYWSAAGRKTATAASPPATPNWSPAREPSSCGTAARPASATRTSSAWRAALAP